MKNHDRLRAKETQHIDEEECEFYSNSIRRSNLDIGFMALKKIVQGFKKKKKIRTSESIFRDSAGNIKLKLFIKYS